MAFKDVYIPFDEFIEQVQYIEVGAIQALMVAIEKMSILNEYRDRYFLPYPFQSSYLAQCIEGSEHDNYKAKVSIGECETIDQLAIRVLVNNDHSTQLPIYCIGGDIPHYNYEEFCDGRFNRFLQSSISKDEFEKKKDSIIILNADRNNAFSFDSNTDYFVSIPNFQGYYVTRKMDGASDAEIFKEYSELSLKGDINEVTAQNVCLITPDQKHFVGTINEYCQTEYGGDYDKTVERVMREIKDFGLTTIYPFEWYEY